MRLMFARWSLACALSLASAWPLPVIAQGIELRVEEPRAYGYVIGDLVERRVSWDLPAGGSLPADALPRPGRVNNWLELREAHVENQGARAELLLTYQVINAPDKVTTTALPALRLNAAPVAGAASAASATASATTAANSAPIDIGPWPITVSPITPEFVLARAGLEALQPDVQPQPQPLRPIVGRLSMWCLLLLVAGWLLAARREPRLAFWRRKAPFRDALADLRRLSRGRGATGEDRYREGLTRLHQAFDATAGRALFAQRLEPLFTARPGLRPLASEVEAFYAESRRVFFAAEPAQVGVNHPPSALPSLTALCRRLAQLEAGR